ncbi:Uncharacterized protein TPAR_08035 [Tolypocladium paradoxum]|uniref:AT hook, DNA-binding motif protein n=1 Tax=Tolypocladium paradoxum TaxID=94208 RepID=A0A2S4KNG0_9HYPO|nr:Uncharacterized protein TPAR_08035 [Tolypocladium paradoxum]
MPPVVIADSDDDDDDEERGYSAPPSPNHGTPVIDAPTRSSDGVSHATVSTDPAFFQSIFNEQKDAANQRTQDAQGEGMMQDKSASSVTSITDPVNQKDRKVGDMKSMGDLNHVTTPRNDTTTSKQIAGSEEVWDVPSSPERRPTSKASKKKSDRTSKTTTVKVTRGVRKPLEKLGYQSSDEDEDGEAMSTRGKKRRRLGPSGSSRQDPKDISLITVPPNDDINSPGAFQGNNTALGSLVPTLPVNADSSFLVGPKPLSASQKLEYQSINPVSSSPPVGQLGLRAANLGSSGTATNINTPRSNLPSSHDVGMRIKTPEAEALRNMRRTRSPRRRRDSSPDEIAATHAKNDNIQAGFPQRPIRSYTNGTVPDGILLNGAGDEHQAEFIPDGQQDGNDDSDFAVPEKPIRPKRQRGRPRKSAKVPDDRVTSSETGNRSTAKPKKKRGRPKKSGAPSDVPAEAVARVTKTVDEAMAGRQVEDGDAGGEESMPAAAQDAGSRQDRAATEEACQTSVPPDRPREVPSGALGPTTAAQGREEKAGVGTKNGGEAKDRNDGKGSSWPKAGAKPVYRVGLSKRGKIAPLLKSLRK